MADKITSLVLEGLSRAAAVPNGLPLHGSKKSPGLFASSAPSKQAALRCKEQEFVAVLRTETRGNNLQEICAITDKGLAFLLDETNPRRALQNLNGLSAARADIAPLLRKCQDDYSVLQTQIQQLFLRVRTRPGGLNGSNGDCLAVPLRGAAKREDACDGNVSTLLEQWQSAHANEDCPLPQLFRAMKQSDSSLTIGQFHDQLRQRHAEGQIYLHPWTGPLYEIPEPALALLVGHAVVYYVSRKN